MDGLKPSAVAVFGCLRGSSGRRSARYCQPRVGKSAHLALMTVLCSLVLWGCSDDKTDVQTRAEAEQPAANRESAEGMPREIAPAPVPLALAADNADAAATEPQASAKTEAQAATTQPGPDRDSRYEGIELSVADIREMTYDGGNTVGILFSVPLDASKPFKHFIKSNRSNTAWRLSDDGQTLYMIGAKPETSYKVTVSPGIEAANGTTLNRSHSASVTTSPAPPSLSFASDGHILPLNGHRGLPVYTQNVASANVSFFRVNDDKINALQHWQHNTTRLSVYRLDDIPQFAELVYEGRFDLTAEKNKRRMVNLPIQNVTALSQAGVYIAVMTRPGQFDNPVSTTWFSVTDLGVHVRSYGSTQHILVHSLGSTEPVANAGIELINRNGAIGHRGQTDQQGSYTLRRPMTDSQMLVVRKGKSVSLLPLNTAALDLSDFPINLRPARNRELYIWSPRDLYRGGETAHFSALLRDADGKSVKSPTLEARLIRPDGQQLKVIKLKSQSNAYYELSHGFADDAMTGDWRLKIKLSRDQVVTYAFKIEDFMPERLKLTFNPDTVDSAFTGKQSIRLPVLGEYLYGAPAAGNRFDATVRVGVDTRPFEAWRDFFFGDPGATEWDSESEQNNLAMNDEGLLSLAIKNTWAKATTPLAIRVTGSLFETGGRAVIRRHKATWLPANNLVGIRPLFKESATANGVAEFELIRTDGTTALSSADNLQITLVNQSPRYHWRYSNGRGWYYERSEHAYSELALSTDLSGEQPTRIQVPVKWGDYRLEVFDPSTHLTSAVDFRAGHRYYRHYADQNGQSARPDQVTLGLDQAYYDAGDVARLSITPPAAGEALVLVEGDQLLWSQRVSVPAKGTTVDIPIDPDWNRHDIYISVLHLQPSDDQQRITPTRAIGITHLPLNRASRHLSLAVKTPEKWLPNRTVNVDMEITDHQGKPVKNAWVTLAAVDVGVLSVTRFETPDPFRYFFEPRRYGVDLYDQYGHIIDFNDANSATLRFGGDAAMARGGDLARSDVQIVSLYSGRVAVKNGKAQIPLTLPDFNGRLRLMAVAFDGKRIGSADEEVTVAAPVVTQLSLPRFTAIGDQSSIALDVTNLSGKPITLTIDTSAHGPVTFDGKPSIVELKHQQKQTLVYPFSATYPTSHSSTLGHITFRTRITGHPDYPIDRAWSLVSRPANPAVTERVRVRLQPHDNVSLTPGQFSAFEPKSLKVQATLNSRANLNPHHQLDNLLHYPYGCLEQTLSSTYPWLYAIDDKLAGIGLDRSSAEKRQQALTHGMERIAKRQMSNGGYGLWSSSDEYEQHWLTAHAADFLTDARDQGIPVDDDVLDRTLTRLNDYIRGRGTLRERWSRENDLYRFAYQSYSAYVLARHQRISLPNIRKLANAVPKPDQPLPLTHLALAAHAQGDKALAQKLLKRARHASRKKTYIGDYGSDLRDQAVQARLLLKSALDSGLADDLLMAIEDGLRARRYLSTQERNSLYLAALEQEKQSPESTKATVLFGQGEKHINARGPQIEHASGDFLQSGVHVLNTGDQSLGVELVYQGQPRHPTASSSGGLSVKRRYFDTKGRPITVRNDQITLSVGDVLVVELTLSSEQYRPDLLLVDLLPAGLELENQNLGDSVKLKELKIENHTLGYWYDRLTIGHQEYRDDRYVAALAMGNDYGDTGEVRLHYLARAVTPGTYQVPAPLLEDMYDPEARAVGEAVGQLVVKQTK